METAASQPRPACSADSPREWGTGPLCSIFFYLLNQEAYLLKMHQGKDFCGADASFLNSLDMKYSKNKFQVIDISE